MKYKFKATFTTTNGTEVYKTICDTEDIAKVTTQSLRASINEALNQSAILTIDTEDGVIGVNMKEIVSFRIRYTPIKEEES